MLFCSKYEYNSDDDAKWTMVIENPIGLAKIGHLLYFCFSVTLPPRFIGETMYFFPLFRLSKYSPIVINAPNDIFVTLYKL